MVLFFWKFPHITDGIVAQFVLVTCRGFFLTRILFLQVLQDREFGRMLFSRGFSTGTQQAIQHQPDAHKAETCDQPTEMEPRARHWVILDIFYSGLPVCFSSRLRSDYVRQNSPSNQDMIEPYLFQYINGVFMWRQKQFRMQCSFFYKLCFMDTKSKCLHSVRRARPVV